MMNSDSTRRRFLQVTAGGLVVSSALTSPDTQVAGATEQVKRITPATGDVLRTTGELSNDGKAILESERAIPLIGKSDVLICGAGPAGIAAALSAARAGASVQLIEVAGCLGGVWTVGLLTKILDAGNKRGIMRELLKKFTERGSQVAIDSNGTVYDPEIAKLVLEEVCIEAGVKIRLHTRVVGAVLDDNQRLVAVLTESKSGREAWQAERFIDCSGDGDLAAHAGCQFEVGTGSECTCQPMSMLALLTGLDPDQVRPW
ncbi:FAD-dependent oxidoreductase, partial [Rubripirellula sp.]|nr:FAD-dependent oxidoreductase [Rubripirellula sp.]